VARKFCGEKGILEIVKGFLNERLWKHCTIHPIVCGTRPFPLRHYQKLMMQALGPRIIETDPHIFRFFRILFLVDHCCNASRTSCKWLHEPCVTTSSIACNHPHVFIDDSCYGIEVSRSFTWTLKSVGDITEPCGTPARHGLTDDKVPRQV
jgi:hypothetical protein